jgi:hypothetical protein
MGVVGQQMQQDAERLHCSPARRSVAVLQDWHLAAGVSVADAHVSRHVVTRLAGHTVGGKERICFRLTRVLLKVIYINDGYCKKLSV